MKCFYHADRDAVGLCKACHKGICSDCSKDLGRGLACANIHENEVVMLNEIESKMTKAHQHAPKGILIGPLFYASMGFLFAMYGNIYRGGATSFMALFGYLCLLFAGITYAYQKNIFKSK